MSLPPKYDVISPQFFADPHAVFRQMRAEDPVYWHPEMKIWMLVRYDDVQWLLRDRRFSSVRSERLGYGLPASIQGEWQVVQRFLSDMLLFNDPPAHTRSRSLINRAFTSKAVEALRPLIQDIVAARIDACAEHGQMDVIAQLAVPLPVAVISKMLGISEADFPRFKGWTEDVVALLGSNRTTVELVQHAHRAVVGLTAFMHDMIEHRRAQPTEDLLGLLVRAEDDNQVLSADEVVATSVLLLLAGYETTTHLIGNGLLALLEHPDQLARLRAQPALIASAVEELLRYNSAVFRLARRARERMELDGHVIEEGQYVTGYLHAANRDPAQFADPDRLDIAREPNYHVGFGYGPHICVGAPVARLEVQIAINALVQRLPDLALAPGRPSWSTNQLIRGVSALPIAFRPGVRVDRAV